jgi:hypothetical protein
MNFNKAEAAVNKTFFIVCAFMWGLFGLIHSTHAKASDTDKMGILVVAVIFTTMMLLAFSYTLLHRRYRRCKKLLSNLNRDIKIKKRKDRVLNKGSKIPYASKVLPKPWKVALSFKNPKEVYCTWNYYNRLN